MAGRGYDHLFKLLLIGDSGVGKSSLLLRFADNTFSSSFVTTIGVDFRVRTVVLGGLRLRLQVWDTAGQERFRTITSTYYRNAHGVIVVYDVTNPDSFVSVKRWMHEIAENCDSVCKVLVGNKVEDPSHRQVPAADARRFSAQLGLRHFETSAKDNINVEEMFAAVAGQVLKAKMAAQAIREGRGPGVVCVGTSKKKLGPPRKCC
ncbi:ras-related protein Rab-35 isoform X1 [Alligator mississippiensis]|uniref:Ras-related protein Rab-35-like n=1 Tax=Alligator mississippiensis TaxID=8496 RepID=A0A151P2U3_ALLMI|nr:ras-related protein Rab-35 isoform X1 [Alligator mississippiensis]KYO43392.1 ras-related protein Rab-35-like [Alligator mississippiensis]